MALEIAQAPVPGPGPLVTSWGVLQAPNIGTTGPTDRNVLGAVRMLLATLDIVLNDTEVQSNKAQTRSQINAYDQGVDSANKQKDGAVTEIKANIGMEFGSMASAAIKLGGAFKSWNEAASGAAGSAEKANATNAGFTAAGEILSHAANIIASGVKLSAEETKALAQAVKAVSDFLASVGQTTGEIAQQVQSLKSAMLQMYGEGNSEVYNILMSI